MTTRSCSANRDQILPGARIVVSPPGNSSTQRTDPVVASSVTLGFVNRTRQTGPDRRNAHDDPDARHYSVASARHRRSPVSSHAMTGFEPLGHRRVRVFFPLASIGQNQRHPRRQIRGRTRVLSNAWTIWGRWSAFERRRDDTGPSSCSERGTCPLATPPRPYRGDADDERVGEDGRTRGTSSSGRRPAMSPHPRIPRFHACSLRDAHVSWRPSPGVVDGPVVRCPSPSRGSQTPQYYTGS